MKFLSYRRVKAEPEDKKEDTKEEKEEEKDIKKENDEDKEVKKEGENDAEKDEKAEENDVKEEDKKDVKEEEEDEKMDTSEAASNKDPMIEGMRQELMDLELRIRHGGLGGVDDFTTWEKQCETAEQLQDFVSDLRSFFFLSLIFILCTHCM